jgi:hypothetical protein
LLLRVISTRNILEEVTLHGYRLVNAVELVPRFLHSFRLNSAIHTVKLVFVKVSGTALADFLDAASSVTTFGIHDCRMEASERDQGVIDLATSLQRNRWIRTLSLHALGDAYLCPILRGIASNSHLKELEIGNRPVKWLPSGEASEAVRGLLESTVSIESIKLSSLCGGEERFGPIAQGLINSESVIDIAFNDCRLGGVGSTLLFKSILQSKTKIRSLCVRGWRNDSARELSAENFIHLLRPAAELQSFELSHVNLDFFGFASSAEFKCLLEAVEKSRLESFSIGYITDQDMCQDLISSIPKMKVRKLQFELADSLERFKPHLVCAVKGNASIYSVAGEKKVVLVSEDLFNERDYHKLNLYAARNKGLSQWITSPSSMARGAWARALAAVRVTGPNAVYDILKTLGNTVGPIEGKRKRKRPIRYAP